MSEIVTKSSTRCQKPLKNSPPGVGNSYKIHHQMAARTCDSLFISSEGI